MSLEEQQDIYVSNTSGIFRGAADNMCVKRRVSFEKQQPIDLSNTRGVVREAADNRSE